MIYHYTLTGSHDGLYFEFWYWSSQRVHEDLWRRIVADVACHAFRAINNTRSFDLGTYGRMNLYVLFSRPEFKNEMEVRGFHSVTVQGGCHLTGVGTDVHEAVRNVDIEIKLAGAKG